MVADRYLRFDVRRPPGGRPFLWPVRVWKVLYPTKRVLKLNLFQQAILGLARARCQDSSEMAELLGLDREQTKSLSSSHNALSDAFFQLQVLNGQSLTHDHFEPFGKKAGNPIKPVLPEIFQINVGKLCNQSCAHCHVDAGPDKKTENMDRATMELCLEIIDKHKIPIVDITGGAPEMNPNFKWLVEECRKMGKKVINRCNLTIIMSNPKYRDLPEFFAQNEVHLISSLPYFAKNRTDSQRGEGVFDDSIEALKLLNKVGYGQPDSKLIIDLVYNSMPGLLLRLLR